MSVADPQNLHERLLAAAAEADSIGVLADAAHMACEVIGEAGHCVALRAVIELVRSKAWDLSDRLSSDDMASFP